jgi:hypothetical protein
MSKIREAIIRQPVPVSVIGAAVLTAALFFMEILVMSPVLALSDRLAPWPVAAVAVYLGGLVAFKLVVIALGLFGHLGSGSSGRGNTGTKSRDRAHGPDDDIPKNPPQNGTSALDEPFEAMPEPVESRHLLWRDAVWVIAAVLVFRVLYDATLGTFLLQRIPQSDALTASFEFLMQAPILAGGYILIAAPLYEEFLFRRIFLGGMLADGRPKILALVVSSALFGLIHLNWLQGVHAFLLGLLLGGIYMKKGSFSLVLLAHVANNLYVWIQGSSG